MTSAGCKKDVQRPIATQKADPVKPADPAPPQSAPEAAPIAATAPQPTAPKATPAPVNEYVEIAVLKACLASSSVPADARTTRVAELMKRLEVTDAGMAAAIVAYADDAQTKARVVARTDADHCAREVAEPDATQPAARPAASPVPTRKHRPNAQTLYIEATARKRCLAGQADLSAADREARLTAFMATVGLTQEALAAAEKSFAEVPAVVNAIKERTSPESCARELAPSR